MAKRPRPVRPTLEKIDSDNVDSEGSVADESSDEREGSSSKKFLFFFLFMMGLCCAGGYGYLEYKKKYSNDEVVVADDTATQEEDQLAQSDPDKVDDKESSQDDPETEDEFIVNTSSENEVITDLNTEQADTSEELENGNEEPEFKIDDLNSNENLLDEEETSTENPEEVSFDLNESTEEPEEKTELTSDDDLFLENSNEEKTSEQETVDPLDEEKLVEPEFEESEPDTLNLNETDEEDSAGDFLPPKESKSVENTEPQSQISEKKSEPERKRPRKLRPLRSGKSLEDESRNRIQTKIKRPSTQGRTNKNNSQAKIRWKELGGKEYQSPNGLIYGPGSREGHRFKHILRHAKDQPNRKGKHGVFQVKNRDEVFLLLDEAYRIAKKRGPPSHVKLYRDGNRTIYTINMNRKVGYIGGQYGAQKNNPSAYKVRLVLEGKKVITAFPL